MDLPVNKIVCGDCLEVMKDWPDESINCCISSPPYWALRDYGTATWEGGDYNCDHLEQLTGMSDKNTLGPKKYLPPTNQQNISGKMQYKRRCKKCGAKRIDKQLGLEPTFEEYIDKLCGIYDEVWRVLCKDGTCWVNLGDTYCGSTSETVSNREDSPIAKGTVESQEKRAGRGERVRNIIKSGIQAKSLCLIPQRFAIEMVNRGWILRNVLIWHKPNPMPSSAKDRFTVDFEYVFFFVKSKKYWFEPQYEPYLTSSNLERPRMGQGQNTKYKQKRQEARLQEKLNPQILTGGDGRPRAGLDSKTAAEKLSPLGRNKRCVWTIPTQAYPEAHFATFPETLVEPMIKAGCPEFVCKKCGKGREKIYEMPYDKNHPKYNEWLKKQSLNTKYKGRQPTATGEGGMGYGSELSRYYMEIWGGKSSPKKFKGYTDCGCNAGWRPGIVLDLFCWFGNGWQGRRPIAA